MGNNLNQNSIDANNISLAIDFLFQKKGYLKKSPFVLSEVLSISILEAQIALKTAKSVQPLINKKNDRFIPEAYTKGDKSNILVIGDLHEPFCLDEYLMFNYNLQRQFNCGTIIFIGDIIDNHSSSYHEKSLDGVGANKEFSLAKKRIGEWYKVFPEATVCVGNHDRLILRKAQTTGISNNWIKDYKDGLNVEGWNFVDNIKINDIYFTHGENGSARKRCKDELMSTVQGHLHSEGYIEYFTGNNKKIFGMQVGCGVDMGSYGMSYAKDGKKPFIGSAVIVKGTPILIPMDIEINEDIND